jgi:hypothetical protein
MVSSTLKTLNTISKKNNNRKGKVFIPMFHNTIHAANERIPVESLAFGMNAIYQAMIRGRR